MNYTQLINKSEDYIEQHLHEKITLCDLSEFIGISEFHFHRVFKSFSKSTLNHFVSRIKLERSAMVLLVNTSQSITQIAYDYGYADASSYCRAFKKHFNLTPTQYRNSKK